MILEPFVALGLLQGLTEFLPISSSGHLWLLQYFFGMTSNLSLEIFLHGASLLAVLMCLWKPIVNLLKQYVIPNTKGVIPNKETRLIYQLLWATLLTVVVALCMQKYILIDLTVHLVAWSLMLTGFLIWISTLIKGEAEMLTWKQATVLGLIQGIAVLPGISRSGITIVTLLLMGLKRKSAVELSFLLSIPTILGALVFGLKETGSGALLSNVHFYYGALACFVVSVLTIKFMLKFINRWWGIWAVYCLGLGGALLMLM